MRVLTGLLLTCLSAIAIAGPPLCGVGPADSRRPQLPSDDMPLALSVAFPADGITVGTASIQVHGSFAGPPNTGVSVNGVSALQGRNEFLGRDVRLQPGANTIAVTVTAASGAVQSVTRSVAYDPGQAPDVELQSAFVGDYSPFSSRYSLSLRSGVANPLVQRIRVDYDTDGTFEIDTDDPARRLAHRYETAGLKLATAEVTLDDGTIGTPSVVVTATRRTLVEDLDVTRETLCKAFEDHRGNLASQQYTAALNAFTADAHPRYQAFIEGLGANGPALAARLGRIVDGTIAQDFAELILARPLSDQPGKFQGYPLQFTRDHDGVWRISAL